MQASPAHAARATPPGDVVRDVPTNMTTALYQAALGPLSTSARYLAAFERFDATGRALPGWNVAAAFATVGWMVFRRLWSALLAYLAGLVVLALLLGVLWLWGGAWPAPVLAGLMLALVLVAFALPGLYGDALLHRHLQRQIADAVAAAPTMRDAMALLERRAGSRARLLGVAAAGAVLALLATAGATLHTLGLEGERALRQAPAGAAPQTSPAAQPLAARASSEQQAPAWEAAAPASAPPASHASAPGQAAPAPATTPEASGGAAPASSVAVAGDAQAIAPQAVPAMPGTPQQDATKPDVAQQGSTKSAAGKPASTKPAARAAVPPSSAADESAARRLYINVGLFAEPANARRAHARLRRAGLPSVLREVTAADGRRLQRVRVGPFSSTAEANAAVARVRTLGLDAAPAAE